MLRYEAQERTGHWVVLVYRDGVCGGVHMSGNFTRDQADNIAAALNEAYENGGIDNGGQPTPTDLAAMRYETVGNLDFEPTDDQLRRVWVENPRLVGLAREWTWGDTEAREQLCAALEQMRREEARS